MKDARIVPDRERILMNRIELLDQNTIDKIAAGEVVERPSSVVKELVENSIDAGATAVTVEISDGGKKLIRITDNGGGIEPDQVRTAFLSHATSKIRSVEDLTHIASLGFRGEALSSIAAVSSVELITRTPSAVSGIRYLIAGGKEEQMEEMGAPEGTTFLVRNLFYNVPARSKFLKSDMTEGNYISALMEQLALSHPEISFKYIQNRQVRLHSSGNNNMKDVIYSVYGREITRSLLELHYENDFMKVDGFIGKPEISRGNRSFENYYINGRYVKDRTLSKAIEDAYKGFLMQHKFPFVTLQIEMDGNDLDVNVHPSKMEVRFSRQAEVYEELMNAVRSTLQGRELIPRVTAGKAEPPAKEETVRRGDIPEPFEKKRIEDSPKSEMKESSLKKSPDTEKTVLYEGISSQGLFLREDSAPDPVNERNRETAEAAMREAAEAQRRQEESVLQGLTEAEEAMFSGKLSDPQKSSDSEAQKNKSSVEPVSEGAASGKAVGTEADESKTEASEAGISKMNLAETGESDDKNDAEQLSLFEEKLLTPEARSRHRLIGQLFETYWLVQFEDNFYIIDQHAAHEKIYYERFVRQFREQTVHTQYISPPMIVSLTLEEENVLKSNMEYFTRCGFEIENFGGREYAISGVPATLYSFTEEELFREMLDGLVSEGNKDMLSIFASRLAAMACKAAVKGNHVLDAREADVLIDELLSLDNPYHCPHGRPTIISMSKSELERKFHRII